MTTTSKASNILNDKFRKERNKIMTSLMRSLPASMKSGKLRKCNTCGLELPDSMFYPDSMRRGKLQKRNICKKCNSAYCKEWRKLHEGYQSRKAIEWRRNNPKLSKSKIKEWRDNNPGAREAHVAVYNAILNKKLVVPDSCEICGSSKAKLQAHHHKGYSVEHRLDVQWLCRSCHRLVHNKQKGVVK